MIQKLAIFLIAGLITSCSSSLVYSPSINLTNQPLKEKEVDLQGGVELMPETRPEMLKGTPTTFGISGQIGYGFSDEFNLTVKGWADAEGREGLVRSGYSINAQFIRPINEKSRWIVLPRIGMALNGNKISGYGIGTSVVYHNSLNDKIGWYSGLGPVWGFRYLEKDINSENEEKLPMGIGIIGNIGFGWEILEGMRINCEINPIYQLNTFDDNSQFLISPTIGLGYTIGSKSD